MTITMLDFNQLFAEQLKKNTPFTAGKINRLLQFMSNNLTLIQLANQSQFLKSKIGVKQLKYQIIDCGAKSQARKPKIVKIWQDELNDLHVRLNDYQFSQTQRGIPEFIHISLLSA